MHKRGGEREQSVDVIIKVGISLQSELAFFVETSPVVIAELKPTQGGTQNVPVKTGIKCGHIKVLKFNGHILSYCCNLSL